MINPTNVPDSVFKQIMSRAPEATTVREFSRAAHGWGMDTYRARYFAREMACWRMLCEGASPDDAKRATGVEPFTLARQLGTMDPS